MRRGEARAPVVRVGLVALTLLAAAAGCSSDGGSTGTGPPAEPSSSISTLTAVPLPAPPPPSGTLVADMRQSSRDAAAGRMEVWIDNDTVADLTPTRIVYRDRRFHTAISGERLRLIPSRSERGYPLTLPAQPACGATREGGTVTVVYAGSPGREKVTVPVGDDTDVVGRYTAARCTEIAVARVATLTWADTVPQDGAGGAGENGTLTLVVRPTGAPGPTLRLETVSGTPVLAPVDGDVWRPDATVRGTDAPSRIELALKPNRCDDHAFLESGGATAFKINLSLGGRPGQITLRMSTAGAAAAITFARTSCGLLSSVSGGG